ncbi:MAG: hypothetical protein LUF25_03100 [Phascolarctobacterium sp.]|nr:hypothetical protein [Phascolarctobacterium sp.]
MRKLGLATILAGTALFGGMTANAAEIQVAKAFPDSHEIVIAKDVMPGTFKSGPKLDGHKIGKRDDDRRCPDKKGHGGKKDNKHGPRNPSVISGVKNGHGGKSGKGPGGLGNGQPPKALGAFTAFTVEQPESVDYSLILDILFGHHHHHHHEPPPLPPPMPRPLRPGPGGPGGPGHHMAPGAPGGPGRHDRGPVGPGGPGGSGRNDRGPGGSHGPSRSGGNRSGQQHQQQMPGGGHGPARR